MLKKQSSILLVLLFHLGGFAQEGQNSRKWELVWEDNFNFFDTTIWEVRDNFDHYGGPGLYSENNVSAQNGNLVLEIRAEEYSCPEWAIDPNWFCVRQYSKGVPYTHTTGWVETRPAYDTQYGYIEARIQFPYQQAFWPAFWTFKGESNENPVNAAEIDIAEQLWQLGPKVTTTNIHKEYCTEDRETYEQGCPEIKKSFRKHSPRRYDWSNWHTYGLEWTSTKLKFYVDGKRIRTIRNHGIQDAVRLILNLGLSADAEVNDSLLPQQMLADYVRVYKSKK